MTTTPGARDDPALRILLWLVAVGFFMQTLDATIVNTRRIPKRSATQPDAGISMAMVSE